MAQDRPADERVLDALAARTVDRPDVVAAFARATLRRVPPRLVLAADPDAVAARLADAFTLLDTREQGSCVIRIRRPSIGLDGRPAQTTVIEIATEDRPFLLSTVTDELERRGHHILRSMHPIVGVERDHDGRVVDILPAREATDRESVLHVELDGELPAEGDDALVADLEVLIHDVRRATDDHDAMRDALARTASELRAGAWRGTDPDEAREVADLLTWLLEDNLILLGMREYRVVDTDRGPGFVVTPGSGLGLLNEERRSRYSEPVAIADLPAALRDGLDDAPLLTLTRTTARSTVQRRVRMEYFGLTERDEHGAILREVRVLGLFTRKGYAEPVSATPVLREKLRYVLEREDVVDGSHDAITLVSLFQALPKDELFQSSPEQLHATLVDLLHAEQHGETRTLVRTDHRARTVSVLVATPRDRYSAELRARIQALLASRFGSERIDVEISLGDRQEALVRFLVHLEGQIPEVPASELQVEVRRLARPWLDAVEDRLRDVGDPRRAAVLVDRIARRLPRAYQDSVDPDLAMHDVLLVDAALRTDASLQVAFHAAGALRRTGVPGLIRLCAVKQGSALELSGFIPILESLGLTVVEEVPFRLDGVGPDVTLHDFGVRAEHIDAASDGPRLADAVLAAWRGHLVVDALNRLVLTAGADWRDVSVLRAYRRLRRQLGTTYTPDYVNATLVTNPDAVTALVRYFHARFEPGAVTPGPLRDAARADVLAALDRLTRLDHDRILRGLFHLVDATVRTNAFRPDAVADDTGEPYLALKLDTSRVPDVPHPVPYREVFVHSPRVEGIHLRAGPVARGGLRWSDRRDDVRTEVLGLLKAQVLKNAVIVPTGAKGGFVVTREPDDPGALREEVRRQYVTFVRALLDVTDDLDGAMLVPPPDVVRHDGDDPYLVVAADRGTATFSDTANALSARYGYWLDDAFASGGSRGYDHKELGVTARGAWVAVQRHFRELGIDTQADPITVAGVGDMSGDVFGNGLLRSRTVQLVAAFDHRHVFLDPAPDPSVSFAERQRLFARERSSWDDYDRSLLSPGGGVHPRDAKVIPISPEVQAVLRIEADHLTPPALIRAILAAPVDLLFAGGIGTFVRASSERDDDVGDRTNDEVRITAADVRARVIGEGANLFVTQAARIEYARHGGRCNQDAIDNAAGVITSDLEVTVKILLQLAEDEGRIDRQERDVVLHHHADDVVAQVLSTVDRQCAALSRELPRSPGMLDAYDVLLERLALTSGLDRAEELVPDSDELSRRAEHDAGLTRPELASLLAWSKRELKESLLGSDVPDDPLTVGVVERAVPSGIAARFGDLLPRHRLRREIVATTLANDVVDRLGITFASRQAHEADRPLAEVVRAFQAARTIVDADRWWGHLDDLGVTQDQDRVRELELPMETLLGELTGILLDHAGFPTTTGVVEPHRQVVAAMLAGATDLGTAQQRNARAAHARWLIDDLVDPDLARFLACARDLALAPDAVAVLAILEGGHSPAAILDTLLRLGEALGVDRLEDVLRRVHAANDWAHRQKRGLAADLRRCRHDAAIVALREATPGSAADACERFLGERALVLEEVRSLASTVEREGRGGLDGVAVAERAVRRLVDRPSAGA